MTDRRRDLALAIKSCLDSLADDAANNDLADLAHFVGLASLMSDTLAGLLTVLILAGIGGLLGYLAYSKARAAFGATS